MTWPVPRPQPESTLYWAPDEQISIVNFITLGHVANISELGDFAFSRNGLTNAFYIGALSEFIGSNRFLDERSMNYDAPV